MIPSPSEKSPHNVPQPPVGVNRDSRSGGRRGLVRAAGVVGGATFLSRVLGMLRDILCARSFGTSWQWDGFIYAFMIPNFFRRLVAEGGLSSAFIPVYSETLEKEGQEAAFRFANTVLAVLIVFFAVLLTGVETALYWLLKIPDLPPTVALALDLLRTFFPYLCFMSLFALGMGILNSHKHFLMPSLGPMILNICWIAAVLWLLPALRTEVTVELRWLAAVLLFSSILQLVLEGYPLSRLGYRLHWVWERHSAQFNKMIRLLIPAVLGFAVVPLNILVDMSLGLMIGEGANSSLWYGNRLMQLPLGVFAVAMGTALLPTLSGYVAREDHDAVERTLRFSLKTVCLIILPCTAGLIVLRMPIIRMLFERGAFDAVSTARTAAVLLCYSLGLFAYSGQKMMISAFYAHHNTKTPARIAVFALLLNIVLNLILMRFLREAGLALATSLSGMMQFGLLIFFYRVYGRPLKLMGLLRSTLKMLAAACAMGTVCFFVYEALVMRISGDGLGTQVMRVAVTMAAGTLSYPVFCWLFRVQEAREALSMLKKRWCGA